MAFADGLTSLIDPRRSEMEPKSGFQNVLTALYSRCRGRMLHRGNGMERIHAVLVCGLLLMLNGVIALDDEQ